MSTLDASILKTVRAYIARTEMSESKFGKTAIGDPGLVSGLEAGRSLRLDTADRVLQYMNEAPIGPAFRNEVEAFLSRTGMKPGKFGTGAMGDPSFVQKLRSGASPRLTTVERVRRWMRDAQPPANAGPLRERRPGRRGAPSQGDAPMLLTADKAAGLLSISARTLHRFRETGEGPAYFRLGGRFVYDYDDLMEWLWSKRETPARERE